MTDELKPPLPATPETHPPAPDHPLPLTHAERVELFGRFSYQPDPRPANPEHVTIDDKWIRENLVTIEIPQLGNRKARVHAKISRQLLRMFEAWEAAGLMPLVLTFDGAWASRFKRGYRFGDAHLSNHAWGTAIDLNARWNPLGHTPAAVGAKGCVLPLVPIANEHGFAWGGDFRSRPDGMHFECFKVL